MLDIYSPCAVHRVICATQNITKSVYFGVFVVLSLGLSCHPRLAASGAPRGAEVIRGRKLKPVQPDGHTML